jgi:citrate lyase subunit beta / citryl-CoA lyase
MSVNRFEMTLPILCAAPDVLAPMVDACAAATVIIDIRKDWLTRQASDAAQAASDAAQAILAQRRPQAGATLCRVGRPDDEAGQAAIERLVALRPHGFVLSGCSGAADIQKFDVMLRVAEATQGIEPGAVALVAELGEDTAFIFSATSFKDVSQRLKAIIFDGQGIARATASQAYNGAAARSGAPLLLARATAVIKAAQAGIACYELLEEQADDPQTIREIALADGFSGVVARNAAHLAALAEA